MDPDNLLMKQKLIQIWGLAGDTLFRYPLIITMAVIAAVSAVTAIEPGGPENSFWVTKLIITSCLGISLLFGAKMLAQRIGKGLVLETAVLVFLTGFYFFLPAKEKDFTEMYAFILIPTFILSHLLVSFIPFIRKSKELNFWQYNKNLFINLFQTAVFTGVLTGGVMLAILAVDQLFDLALDELLYPKTLAVLSITGSCFIFLLFNGRGLSQLERDDKYPQILKFFTQYVLIPLLFIYVIILYFYSAKILINWELPRGWVSYLIIAYSVIGIFALLLVFPLKEDGKKSWVKGFSRAFYYTLAPLIILLFTAVFTRILEYGYTEPRYYVLLIAVWLTIVVIYYIIFKNGSIRFIPVSLFTLGLFSLVLPYFNALAVSKRSQQNELTGLLATNNLLVNGKIDFSKKIPSKTVSEIADKFNFLYQRGDRTLLYHFMDKSQLSSLERSEESQPFRNINGMVSGFFKNVAPEISTDKRREIYSPVKAYSTEGYQYVVKLNSFENHREDNSLSVNGDRINFSNSQDRKNQILELQVNGDETFDLLPFIKNKIAQYPAQTERIAVGEISTIADFKKYQIKVIFLNLSCDGANPNRYYFTDAFMLIKVK